MPTQAFNRDKTDPKIFTVYGKALHPGPISRVAQEIKSPLVMPASNTALLNCILAAPLLTPLPDNTPGRAAKDDPSTWDPATHVGNPEGASNLLL